MITNFSTSSVRTGIKRKRFWDQSAVANSFFSIATVNVGAGGASNVEFTNIPQTYTHLQIRAFTRDTRAATANNLYIQFNGDTGSNYAFHYIEGNGSTAVSSGGSSVTVMLGTNVSANTAANIFAPNIIDILDYKDTNKFKTMRLVTGYDANGAGSASFWSGLWRNTNAITSIKLYPNSGNFVQYTSIALYGVLA